MRSLLFVPGDSERKLSKALESGADALIIDLEDAVAEARKATAREQVKAWLQSAATNPQQQRYVRINPLDSVHEADDLAAVVSAPIDGIVLPKSDPDGVRALCRQLTQLEATRDLAAASIHIIAITMETPRAVFSMGDYHGASPRLQALTFGAEDLAAALGSVNRGPDGYEDVYKLTRAWCLLGAGAAEVDAIDTVYPDFKDSAGFEAECVAARRSGFAGKLAIHPDQVAIINRVFTPSETEIAWARRVDAEFSANPERGVVGMDGKMLDRPHWLRARRLLSRLQ